MACKLKETLETRYCQNFLGEVIFAWNYGYNEIKSKKNWISRLQKAAKTLKMEMETDWRNQNNGYKIHS